MASPSHPPAVDQTPDPEGGGQAQGSVPARSQPWWRKRAWNRDIAALARIRDGLRAIPDDPSDQAGAPDQAGAAQAGAADQTGAAQPAEQTTLHKERARPPEPAQQAQPPEPAQQAQPPEPAQQAWSIWAKRADGPAADAAAAAIRETFAYVADAGDRAVAHFYAWLFARHPELRELFPVAMDESRDRLLQALVRIVDSLSTPDHLVEYLTQLGRDHRKYSLEPWMYQAAEEALLGTVRAYAGKAFTPAAEEAWSQALRGASALMIRGAEQQEGPSQWPAEVVGCEYRGHGIAVITVAPRQPLSYAAGQHVGVQTSRWPRVWRTFSVACAPRHDGLMSFHVKAVPGGWVSTALVRHTALGDELILGPALGTMTLQPAADRDLLCVAGGTGLAPLKAISEQVITSPPSGRIREIFLFWGARTQDELYDLPDLDQLRSAYPWFHVIPVISDDPAFSGLQGNVGQVAAHYVPHSDCEAYVAGPAPMVREAIGALGQAGLPGERIHYDGALMPGRPQAATGS